MKYLVRRQIASAVKRQKELNIVIGAGDTKYENWISTDLQVFDALNVSDWSYIFTERCIDRILMEHVIDYWKEDQYRSFLNIARPYLSPKGFIRIAVPDGFNSNSDYIKYVKSGVDLVGRPDRKEVLYNYAVLTKILSKEKYNYRLLEYFDEKGSFNRVEWKKEDGFVQRSAEHDYRNKKAPFSYTSLVVDIWPKRDNYEE